MEHDQSAWREETPFDFIFQESHPQISGIFTD
jgi:hypothetical protein